MDETDNNVVDMILFIDNSSKDTKFNKKFLTIVMKELRKSKIRRSDLVMQYGPQLIKNENGIELWNLYEQLCLAALDLGNITLADDCLKKLSIQFPDSSRVLRLNGMKYEAQGAHENALGVYTSLLAKNPANISIMKRKVCLLKSMNLTEQVVTELNQILKLFPTDGSCWLELGECYLESCDYEAAAHCFEELVLLNDCAPHHIRLADTYYSI
eukprot:gene16735-22894_t